MHRTLSLARKELSSALNSAVAYVTVLFFLLASAGWFFFIHGFVVRDQATLRGYFELFPALFILIMPALTMRSWAEERKMGSDELLLCLPYSESELVMGKFLGCMGLVCLMLCLSLPLSLSAVRLGDFDGGEIAGEYLGALLLASLGAASGQLVSSLCRNQASAFVLSSLVMLFLVLAHLVPAFQPVSLLYRYDSFVKGVLDTRDVSFFLVASAACLFMTARILELRRWS